MELFDVQRLPTKGGSIRGFARKTRGGRGRIAPIVSELLALEERLGLGRIHIFRNFAADLGRIKSQLLALLQKSRAEGKTIAGYGASATVTTLIYNFELG